jgi:ClpP class serine protease
VRSTNAAIYRGELAIRAGLADQLGTLDLAIAEMAAELDRTASTARMPINPTPKRSLSMATTETEQIRDQPKEPQQPVETQPVSTDAAPDPKPTPPQPASDTGLADKLRAEFGEIAAVTAQAARLGVTVDAADAMRKGISSDALRRSVLDTLAARTEATSVIAAAPSTPTAGDSPIVRRAKERAAAARG